MKIGKKHLLLPVLAVGMLAGCGPTNKTITSSPSPCVITPDSAGIANLDVAFNIPANYISKRSRLFITPALVVDDSVVDQLEPL